MKTKIVLALLAGGALLAACKGRSGNYELSGAATTDSAKIMDSIAGATGQPKLVKTAELHFKVKNVEQTSADISALTTKYNGMVMHHQMNSYAERSSDVRLNSDSIMRVTALHISADMTAKVPSERLETFMNETAKMGVYVSLRRMDIEDRTLDYLANRMKLESRRQIIDKQSKGQVVIKHAEDVMALKDDMIDQQISNQRVNEAVKYSVVNISMYQSNTISREIIANDDPSAYGLPFFSQLKLALSNGWYIFKAIIIGGANFWAVFLAAGLIWWGIVKYKRRKTVAA